MCFDSATVKEEADKIYSKTFTRRQCGSDGCLDSLFVTALLVLAAAKIWCFYVTSAPYFNDLFTPGRDQPQNPGLL